MRDECKRGRQKGKNKERKRDRQSWLQHQFGCSWTVQILRPKLRASMHFCCIELCLSPETRTRTFVPEKRCPASVQAASPATSCSHGVLLPTILGCNCQQSLTGSTVIQLSVGNQQHGGLILAILAAPRKVCTAFFQYFFLNSLAQI